MNAVDVALDFCLLFDKLGLCGGDPYKETVRVVRCC